MADSGASFVGSMLLHLEGGTRRHFLEFVAREYPQLVAGYGRLYAGKYASASYATRFRTVMGILKAKYGIRRERAPAAGTENPHAPVSGRQPAAPPGLER